MSQETLIFIVLSVFGVYGVRYAQRLAPLNSELPLKTLLATLLCALAVGLGVAFTVKVIVVLGAGALIASV